MGDCKLRTAGRRCRGVDPASALWVVRMKRAQKNPHNLRKSM